ncbi:MAG: hypothetical protein Q4A06_01450 [Cardiobacteriaceae bacterium]|nr:hypothetical protein [Cardiobacteriaceae bacterium]
MDVFYHDKRLLVVKNIYKRTFCENPVAAVDDMAHRALAMPTMPGAFGGDGSAAYGWMA